MKNIISIIALMFSFTCLIAQERTLTWSVGEPTVTCGATTTICYPLEVAISDDSQNPSLAATTFRFFTDNNYLTNFVVQDIQSNYNVTNIQVNNSYPVAGPLGFTTSGSGTGSYIDITINPNPASLLALNLTPTKVLDLCFDVAPEGVTDGEANNELCAPIIFDNDHTDDPGATNDTGYLSGSEGITGLYYLNDISTIISIAADDEVAYFNWTPDPAFDGILDSAGDTVGDSNTNDCTPYLCDVVYIQTVSGPWDIATNWIDGVVPTINDDAIIDTNVDSYLRQDQAVNNLELRPGSTVSIPDSGIPNDPYILNIVGNVQNDGDFTLYNANQDNSDPLAPTIGTNGNPNVDGEVLLNGPATQTLSGTGNYYNLRVDNSNGVVVNNPTTSGDPTEINGILFVDNGDFNTDDNVLFPCFFIEVLPTGPLDFPFANGRAGQIGPVNGSITGNVNVEQCYPGRRAYRIVSPSTTAATSIHTNWQEGATAWNDNLGGLITQTDVNPDIDGAPFGYGTHITGLGELPGSGHTITPAGGDQFQGLDWQPSGNPSMFEFNATGTNAQTFIPLLDTDTNTLTAGESYLMIIRGSREVDLTSNASATSNTKLRSTGTPEVGVYSVNSGVNADDFVLLGNPYHSIVDMTQVAKTGLTDFIYVFDPTKGGNTNDTNPTSVLQGDRGAYVTIDLNNPPGSASSPNEFLQAYQGFFMQATQASPSITFNEANKAVRQEQLDVFSTPTDRIALTLYDQNAYSTNGTADDRVVINFGQNENNGIDYDDAVKFNNPDENLARTQGGELMSVEYRSMPQIDEILELHTEQYRTTDYVFVVEVNGLNNNSVYLYDNYTDTETLLDNDISTAVTFSVDESTPESIASNRFEIRFQSSTLGTNDFDLQGLSVYPNPASDILNISFGENTGRFETLELFDISGRLVAKQAIGSQLQETQVDVNTFSSGVYLLKVSAGSEEFTTKVIVE